MNFKIIVFYLFLFSSLSSCTNNKSYGTIYYFEQMDMHTIIPLNCMDIFDMTGLKKLDIKSKEIYDLLVNIETDSITTKNYQLDVRYKIIIGSDSFCLDYMGHYELNNNKSGKINFMDELEEYILKNDHKSFSVTESTPKPWGDE